MAEAKPLFAHMDEAARPQDVLDAGVVTGVPAAAAPLLATWMVSRLRRSVLLISPEPESAYQDALFWAPKLPQSLFPAADTPPFDSVAPSEEVVRRRVQTVVSLHDRDPRLVITSAAALLRPTLDPAALEGTHQTLEAGQPRPMAEVVTQLVELGFQRATTVTAPGDFAVRGGIVDIFDLVQPQPWRVEWFGNEIESIRSFDVETQVSTGTLARAGLTPARELDFRPQVLEQAQKRLQPLRLEGCRPEIAEIWRETLGALESGAFTEGAGLLFPYLFAVTPSSLLRHLPADTVILYAGGREGNLRSAARYHEEMANLHGQEMARGELPGGAALGLLAPEEVGAALRGFAAAELVRESTADSRLDLGWRGVDVAAGDFRQFLGTMAAQIARGGTVLAVSRQRHRIQELVADADVAVVSVEEFDAAAVPLHSGALELANGEIGGGFAFGDVAIYSDHELFGLTKRRGSLLSRGSRRALSTSARGTRRAARGNAAREAFVLELSPGDLVAHRDHGIARFVEMRSVDNGEGAHEYMVLEYADSDRLLVPVEHLDRVDRYLGGSDVRPALSKLGSGEWEKTKGRVKQKAEEVARDLLGLYSRREMAPGHAYAPDSDWQRELEAAFPYQETPDQELVLAEIKRDMEQSRPMDRVVCGDVGFGKTELALRAAFKAASEGRQVAMLVPTTVLCQQHYLTFAERLRPFPLVVAQLSRFCSDEEMARTVAGLRSGAVDIVIGTHRLLQKDVEFRNLGLVIIDEEQRFGVMQKERLKKLRVAVDVLSLSATPIPRTLHMSLAGIRDLSVIQTPPEERQPIKTYVTAREETLIREVITRELARGGQVFYLHNRVQTIELEADMIRAMVPEARVAVGHGQMPEDTLAAVMRSFSEGEVDVLVCTTIIESGLDIPNANTIIVNDAHRLGLAQLYQLRGRVGRAGVRAYAYILYPPQKSLTERADKRLDTIGDLQDLGSGFKLAMRDLEIRGAGNLLGEEQHGEIAAVGLELYNALLRDAVSVLQGKPVAESTAHITVTLPLPAYFPSYYVTDEKLRLRTYQQLAACTNETELEKGVHAVQDRFGGLPEEAENLVYCLRARLLAASAGVQAVETAGSEITLQLPLDHGLDLHSVTAQFRQRLRATASRLYLRREGSGSWQQALLDALRELARLRRRAVAADSVPVA